MKASDRGEKHSCPKCDAKYYDLRKAKVVCPSCGARPAEARHGRMPPSRKMPPRVSSNKAVKSSKDDKAGDATPPT